MLTPQQQDWIEQARRADILAVAQRAPVSAKLKKHTREWVGPCPACGGEDRFAVNPKKKGGLFNCRGAGGGDVIAMMMHVAGVEFLAACEIINGAPMPAGEERVSAAEIAAAAARREAERAARDADRDAEQNRYRAREHQTARAIYDAGVPIAGTPGEAYFALRGIMDLPADVTASFRYGAKVAYFHGTAPNEIGQDTPRAIWRGPAVLAPIVDAAGAFQGVHITWIDLDQGNGKAIIADPDSGKLLDSKKVRGSQSGCVIWLSYPRDGFSAWCVGEGIETTLSVWFARLRAGEQLGDVGFAAAINLGNMAGRAAESVPHPTRRTEKNRVARVTGPLPDLTVPGLPLPAGVARVLLLGDGDSDAFDTQCALARAGARIAHAGAAATVAWAPHGDFNDVLRAAGVGAVAALLRQEAAPAAPEIPSRDAGKKPSARRKPRSIDSAALSDANAGATAPSDPSSFSSFAPPPVPPTKNESAATLAGEGNGGRNGRGNGNDDAETEEAERKNRREEQIEDCSRLDHSDTDNGKRLIAYFGEDLLVRREAGVATGAWLKWTGTHWDIDDGAAGCAILAQQVGAIIMEEARYIEPSDNERATIEDGKAAKEALKALGGDDDASEGETKIAALMMAAGAGEAALKRVYARRSKRREHGLKTKMRARMAAMQECAGPHMRVSPDDFNPDALKLATRNATLYFVQRADPECPDPAATRLKWVVVAQRGHRRDDLITGVVPIDYDENAVCPRWCAELGRFQPDADQRRTVQQFTGMGLTGKLVQRLMFHFGTGGNFKSTFLEVVMRVLGDSLTVGLPTELLVGEINGNAGGARPDLERLFGKRMLRVLEMPRGTKLRADLIKKLTGGERWPVRTLYKSFYEFTPHCKPHMSGNDYPEFDGSDGGMARRLLVIEWPIKITSSEEIDFDVMLAGLLVEAPGILNWLIAGALDYLNNGLVVSEKTLMTTRAVFDEMDPVARFVRDCVEPTDETGANIGAREMFIAYKAHCAANARSPIYETRFGRIMKQRYAHDDTARKRVYLGVRLHDVPEIPAEEPPPHGYGAPPRSESPASQGEDDDRVPF